MLMNTIHICILRFWAYAMYKLGLKKSTSYEENPSAKCLSLFNNALGRKNECDMQLVLVQREMEGGRFFVMSFLRHSGSIETMVL